MNINKRKNKEDEKSDFFDTTNKVIGIVGAVVGLLWLNGSGSKKEEKMMKAPRKDGYIVRRECENSPKDYFKDLRGKKKRKKNISEYVCGINLLHVTNM
ncbi:unnamed protein product, partial [Eruca vesicaria subsp. sativa]|nr:unnamed protein product [Eruca vesicaria subsp. sativa]